MREKLQCRRDQLVQGKAKIERMSHDLDFKYTSVESAMNLLLKNRAERLEKSCPNLVHTLNLGYASITEKLLLNQSAVIKQKCKWFPLCRLNFDGEKKDGFTGDFDCICDARLPRGLDPHSVPSEELATSLGIITLSLHQISNGISKPMKKVRGISMILGLSTPLFTIFPNQRLVQLHRRLVTHSSSSLLHFHLSSHYLSTANPAIINTDKSTVCSDDPFKIHPAFHCLSAIKSKSQLLKSYSVTPPIQPWPQYLSPKRLINLVSTQHDLELALDIFHYAGKYHRGFTHNYPTYYFIIRKLCKARAFDHVETLLAELKDSGIYCSENIFIIVIRNYGIWSKPKEALRLFIRMNSFRGVERSTKSFNTLLNALVQNKQYNLVHGLFKICYEKFHIVPNVITCNILIKALCNKNDIDSSLRILEEMPEIGIIPNLVSYTTVLRGYVVRDELESAKKVFDEIRDRGWLPDVMTYTILIDGFCRRGLLVDAIKLMDDMAEDGVEPNEVTYSVMIEAFCREKKSGEATNLINDMLEKRYLPSIALCCRLIDVLCQEGKVENACVLWEKMRIKNASPDNAILNTLIYWLCKKDKIHEARKLFNEFERGLIPSELTYNMLITAMCEKGELSEAGRLWDDMVAKGFAPSAITYSQLIKECCRVGNSKEGIRVLEEMLDRGCTPDRSTYSILIKCLRDSGSESEIAHVPSIISVSGNAPEAKT